MPLRVTFHESKDADGLVETLALAGFEAGTTREQFAGDGDGEEVVYVVHTDAPTGEVEELVADAGADARVEVTDPMSGTAAPVAEAADLPAEPQRGDDTAG